MYIEIAYRQKIRERSFLGVGSLPQASNIVDQEQRLLLEPYDLGVHVLKTSSKQSLCKYPDNLVGMVNV